jgi:glyoxylase-like metal-dependent hydrolase (beta-lactamase superfamily II)
MIQTEQIDEVHKFRLARSLFGRGLYFTTAYWVDGMMIDTGCAHTVRELIDALKGHQVDLVVNTHSHEDHVAGNAALQELYGAEVLAHPLAIPVIENRDRRPPLHPYRRLLWGHPVSSKGKAIGESVETRHHRFQVIHTPGHSPDHICLYEPAKGWVFSGDLFVGGRDRALRADYSIWQIIESLKKLAPLDISLLFPGSGSVRRNPRDEIIGKIEYLDELGERVLSLYHKGMGYARIRRKLFGAEMPIAYLTLGHFSGKNLIRSYVEDSPTTGV